MEHIQLGIKKIQTDKTPERAQTEEKKGKTTFLAQQTSHILQINKDKILFS